MRPMRKEVAMTTTSPSGGSSSDSNDEENIKLTKAEDKSAASSKPPSALFLLTLMVVQNSSTVLVGRYTRSVALDMRYEVRNLILLTEVGKLLVASILEHRLTPISVSIRTHVLSNPIDFLRIMVPALLYLVQNSLLYVALSNLSAPLFQVTYQMKTLTTAVVSVVMLDRRYNITQWLCLLVLGIGVAVVVTGEKPGSSSSAKIDNMFMLKGLSAVAVACLSSALAGVYFEKVLKKHDTKGSDSSPQVSLWMRNVQLAFFSILIAIGQCIYKTNSSSKPFFHGFGPMVYLLLFLQVAGGLLVAAIIKYADNVLKGLATGVSVVVSTFCSMMIFGTPLSVNFVSGATLILGSVFLFSTRGDKPKVSSFVMANDKNPEATVEIGETKKINVLT